MNSLSIQDARRIALAAQGFHRPRPIDRPVDLNDFDDVISRVKIVQIDPINVLVRAHYMPFFSRLGPYSLDLFERFAYEDRKLYECFAHQASFIPTDHLPMLRHRMIEWSAGKAWRRFMDSHPGIEESVMSQIRRNGALTVSEIEEKGERYGHWGMTPAKLVLETMLRRGELAIHGRLNGARQYDLTERVAPAELLNRPAMSKMEARRAMVMRAVDAMGIATAPDIADYYRFKRSEADDVIQPLVREGMLQSVQVEGARRPVFAKSGLEISDKAIKARSLLSPFDPLVWFRERLEWLFDFEYRIEIYTPAKKRRYGYYVLPFLLDEQLAARVDLKADRRKRVLRVPSAFLEEGRDADHVAHELAVELREMAAWLNLDRIVIGRKGSFTIPLRAAVKQL